MTMERTSAAEFEITLFACGTKPNTPIAKTRIPAIKLTTWRIIWITVWKTSNFVHSPCFEIVGYWWILSITTNHFVVLFCNQIDNRLHVNFDSWNARCRLVLIWINKATPSRQQVNWKCKFTNRTLFLTVGASVILAVCTYCSYNFPLCIRNFSLSNQISEL